jgi:D-alanyl-D-alanine carboxypeptidase
MIIGGTRFNFPVRIGVNLLIGVALLLGACSRPESTTTGSSALKPIDQAALQTVVDATAKELMIPGALVLLRTPQGQFTVGSGTTLLGANSVPRADTYFRIASNTKTMTAAVIVLLAAGRKAQPRRSSFERTSQTCPTATTSPSPNC